MDSNIDKRELVAAMLLALSNDSFVSGFDRAIGRNLIRENKLELEQFKSAGKASLEPAWVLASVMALSPGFIIALRQSVNRQKFLEAADILIKNVLVETSEKPCRAGTSH